MTSTTKILPIDISLSKITMSFSLPIRSKSISKPITTVELQGLPSTTPSLENIPALESDNESIASTASSSSYHYIGTLPATEDEDLDDEPTFDSVTQDWLATRSEKERQLSFNGVHTFDSDSSPDDITRAWLETRRRHGKQLSFNSHHSFDSKTEAVAELPIRPASTKQVNAEFATPSMLTLFRKRS